MQGSRSGCKCSCISTYGNRGSGVSNIECVVLVSGGMDSCVTAGIALQDLKSGSSHGPANERAAFLHVSYGQRTAARELRSFREIARFYGVGTRLAARMEYLQAIGGSALTDSALNVPAEMRGGSAGPPDPASGVSDIPVGTGRAAVPITYVPFRNTHLLAIAVSWAEVLCAQRIYIGAVAEDSSGYPDCRPEYYAAFNQLIRVGTRPETRLEVATPVIHLRKSAIVERGIELGAPLHLTWSCYKNEDIACGICESCGLRRRAFEQAGHPDPIPYADTTHVTRWAGNGK
ncbi:MAG: 7-cyano-7-deazaguanine synthase [Acidobacteria bacterium]|nr:7-cyano-7-deazaguanine synthase [Acidobacteriota bacterium]